MQWLEKAVQDLTESVKSYVSKAMLSVDEKIASIEKRVSEIPAGKDGRDGVDGKNGIDGVGKDGVNGENGKDGKDGLNGKDADPAVLEKMVEDRTESIRTILESRVDAAIETAVKSIPIPKDGVDGKDGINGKDGTNGVDGKDADPEIIKSEVQKALSEIPQPNIAEVTIKSLQEIIDFICQGLNEPA